MSILPPRPSARIRPYLVAVERRRRADRQRRAVWIARCQRRAVAERIAPIVPGRAAA